MQHCFCITLLLGRDHFTEFPLDLSTKELMIQKASIGLQSKGGGGSR